MKILLGFILISCAVFIVTVALVVIGQEISAIVATLLFVALTYISIRYGLSHLTRL